MEAVCLTCQVRYEFEDELLLQGSPVVCPTCQVSLVPVHPGTNTPLDQPLDAGAVLPLQQREYSPPSTSTETTVSTGMATPKSPSAGQAEGPGSRWDFGNTQWDGATQESASRKSSPPNPVQTSVSPAFEAPKWDDIAKPLESLPAQPALAEQSLTFRPATPSAPKAAPSAPPLEDWSSAAARWAASGFSEDAMPEFIKQPARPNFSPVQPATQTKSFLPTAPPAAPDTRFLEPAFRSQSEALIPTPPPLPAPAEVPTVQPPELGERHQDSIPPWARGESEAEANDRPADAHLALSTALPVTPLAVAVEMGAAPEHQVEDMTDEPVRSSHVLLWAMLVLLLAGAGGAAVWYFFLQEETTEIDSADKQTVGIANTPAPKNSIAPNKVPKPTQTNPTSQQVKTPESARTRILKDDNPAERLSKKDSPSENANLSDAGLEAYKKGNNFIREGKFKEAVSEFRKALMINPKLSQAHRGLGISFAQLRQNRQACQEYRLYRNMLPADSKEIPALESILKDCR